MKYYCCVEFNDRQMEGCDKDHVEQRNTEFQAQTLTEMTARQTYVQMEGLYEK